MFKPKDPKELAIAMISRSTCAVKVGAVLADKWGIFAWGRNHCGPDGMGQHAEVNCLLRSNFARSRGATMYVAAERARTKRIITARPCEACQRLICKRVIVVWYRDGDGVWRVL